MSDTIRRNRIDLLTSEEKMIRDTAIAIEAMWASVELTEITTLLWKSKDLLSDYIEKK